MKTVIATFDSLSYSGYGSGMTEDGRPIYAWNAYPGETAQVKLFGYKKEPLKGTAIEILKPSKYRISPRESHFLITSPWQTIQYEREIIWKQMIVRRLWKELVNVELPELTCIHDNYQFHYRNSIEFNITATGTSLSVALMKRGRQKVVPVSGSALAYECINDTAHDIVSQLSVQG
jgi:tRNA/tmRNA/rRNA uracil-C5-methylase (TrmA/RlmC/RlmD family)